MEPKTHRETSPQDDPSVALADQRIGQKDIGPATDPSNPPTTTTEGTQALPPAQESQPQ